MNNWQFYPFINGYISLFLYIRVMETKKNNKIIITGGMICKAAGFISFICGIILFIKGIVTDNYDYPAMAIAFGASIILLGLYKRPLGTKR